MRRLWTKDGRLVMGGGVALLCDDCPCDERDVMYWCVEEPFWYCVDENLLPPIECQGQAVGLPRFLCLQIENEGGGDPPGTIMGCADLFGRTLRLEYDEGASSYTDSETYELFFTGSATDGPCNVSFTLRFWGIGFGGTCGADLNGALGNGVVTDVVNKDLGFGIPEPEPGWTLDPVYLLFTTTQDSVAEAGRYTVTRC